MGEERRSGVKLSKTTVEDSTRSRNFLRCIWLCVIYLYFCSTLMLGGQGKSCQAFGHADFSWCLVLVTIS